MVSCISKKLSVSYSHEEKQQGQTNTKQIFAKPTALEAFKGVELSKKTVVKSEITENHVINMTKSTLGTFGILMIFYL